MRQKKLILTFISVTAILLFFITPFYNEWLFQRILNPHLSIVYQAQR